jgi:osmotically-inducible protein OsmY
MKTDPQLQSDVRDELAWLPKLSAAHIEVSVTDGVVTLSGEVSHHAQKQDAEDAAKAIYGVRAVANDIGVRPQDRIQIEPSAECGIQKRK